MNPTKHNLPHSSVMKRLLRAYFRARYAILIVTILLFSGAVYPAYLFPSATDDKSIAPKGTRAYTAQQQAKLIVSPTISSNFMVYFDSLNKEKDKNIPPVDQAQDTAFLHFDYHLQYYCYTGKTLSMEYISTHPGNSFYFKYNKTNPYLLSYLSYRSVIEDGLPFAVARSAIEPGNLSSVVKIVVSNGSNAGAVVEFSKRLKRVVPILLSRHNLIERGVVEYIISVPSFIDAIESSIGHDMKIMLIIVTPIVLLLFGGSLSSGRSILIPLVVLPVSVISSFSILYFITVMSHEFQFTGLSPGICLMMSAAFTFDYSYFWASQYRSLMVDYVESHGGVYSVIISRCEKRKRREEGKRRRIRLKSLWEDKQHTTDNPNLYPTNVASHSDPNREEVVRSTSSNGSFNPTLDSGYGDEFNYESSEFQLLLLRKLYQTAGRTIFISSQACALCSLGAVYFDSNVIRSIGITAVVTSECVGMTALILPAALISAFPNFFFGSLEGWCNAIHPDDCIGSPSAPAFSGNKREYLNGSVYGTTIYERIPQTNPLPLPLFNDRCNKSLSPISRKEQTTLPKGTVHEITRENNNVREGSPILNPHECHDRKDLNQQYSANSDEIISNFGNVSSGNMRSSVSLLRRSVRATAKYYSSEWKQQYQFFNFIVDFPQNIFFITLTLGLLSIPIFYTFHDGGIEYSDDIQQFVPRNARVMKGWKIYSSRFPPGTLYPFRIIMEYPKEIAGTEVWRKRQWEIPYILSRELPHTRIDNFNSVAFSGILASTLGSPNISSTTDKFCLTHQSRICRYINLSKKIFNSSNDNVIGSYFIVELDFDPTNGLLAKEWYNKAINILERESARYGSSWKMYLDGRGAVIYSLAEYSANVFIIVVVASICIVFITLCISFGSLVIAIRILFCVMVSVVSAFGMTILVYGYGIFNWTTWSSISRTDGTMAFEVPIAATLISAGIALNYEVVTMTKVMELRWRGFDTRRAIIVGCTATFREVNVAAGIMVIFFFGFLFSTFSPMNEVGAIFLFTAVIEGFIVRLFLTPATMGLLGNANWFPLQFCVASFIPPVLLEGDSDDDDIGVYHNPSSAEAIRGVEDDVASMPSYDADSSDCSDSKNMYSVRKTGACDVTDGSDHHRFIRTTSSRDRPQRGSDGQCVGNSAYTRAQQYLLRNESRFSRHYDKAAKEAFKNRSLTQ